MSKLICILPFQIRRRHVRRAPYGSHVHRFTVTNYPHTLRAHWTKTERSSDAMTLMDGLFAFEGLRWIYRIDWWFGCESIPLRLRRNPAMHRDDDYSFDHHYIECIANFTTFDSIGCIRWVWVLSRHEQHWMLEQQRQMIAHGVCGTHTRTYAACTFSLRIIIINFRGLIRSWDTHATALNRNWNANGRQNSRQLREKQKHNFIFEKKYEKYEMDKRASQRYYLTSLRERARREPTIYTLTTSMKMNKIINLVRLTHFLPLPPLPLPPTFLLFFWNFFFYFHFDYIFVVHRPLCIRLRVCSPKKKMYARISRCHWFCVAARAEEEWKKCKQQQPPGMRNANRAITRIISYAARTLWEWNTQRCETITNLYMWKCMTINFALANMRQCTAHRRRSPWQLKLGSNNSATRAGGSVCVAYAGEWRM